MGYFATTDSLVEVENPLDQEILAWEARIEEKGKELAGLSQRVQDMKNMLNVFAGEYNSRVGVHYVTLDKIELQIKEYRLRMEKLRAGVKDLAKLREIEKEIDTVFSEEREKIKQKEKETSRSSEAYKKHLHDRERGEMLGPEMQRKIKVLFRKLALKFHPDKAGNDDQAKEFQEIMAAINEAYANGDLQVLILYMERAEREEKIAREACEEKLARLKGEYEKICLAIEKLQKQLASLLASDICRLKQMAEDAKMEGKDLLMELTNSAIKSKREKQQELDKLIAKYQGLVSSLS